VYTPASGKKKVTDCGNGEARCMGNSVGSVHREFRGKPTHASCTAYRRAVPAQRGAQETSKPLAPYAVEHQLQLLISHRTVL